MNCQIVLAEAEVAVSIRGALTFLVEIFLGFCHRVSRELLERCMHVRRVCTWARFLQTLHVVLLHALASADANSRSIFADNVVDLVLAGTRCTRLFQIESSALSREAERWRALAFAFKV